MCNIFKAIVLLLGLMLVMPSSYAVQPDEVLQDEALEKRARNLSLELRCLVCQNQSIDDSDAPLARDLRILVRDRLKKGETDKQVIDYVVDRYGEFVLLRPRFATHTLILWLAPPVLLLLGSMLLFRFFRQGSPQGRRARADSLTAKEKRELKRLLKKS